MTISTRKSFQAAVDKAQQLRPQVTDLGGGRYSVQGSTKVYAVTVDQSGEYSCTCPAGQNGQACYHQGSVYLRRLGEQACGCRPLPAITLRPTHETAAPSSRDGRGIGMSAGSWSEADDDGAEYAATYGTRVAA